jgi:hypothetical protein
MLDWFLASYIIPDGTRGSIIPILGNNRRRELKWETYTNADTLATGDICSRIGTRQADLSQLRDALDNENWSSWNVHGVEKTRREYIMRWKKTNWIINIIIIIVIINVAYVLHARTVTSNNVPAITQP